MTARYHSMEATSFQWEIQMGRPPDNISICICKTPESGIKEVIHLNRRMRPPVRKLSL
jgi:hypothetical protein